MKQTILLGAVAIALSLFIACGSESENAHDHMQIGESMESGDMQMKTSNEWIRSGPIDLKALDINSDGYVYQDQMDWNVIADEEGKCPKCGMILGKVTIEEAATNLRNNGYTVK